MPIYEYVCHSCGAELEKIQRFSDEPLRDCPECGEAALKKKVSAAGFRLKGGGWYVTDFRDKKTSPSGAGQSAGKDNGGKGAVANSKASGSDTGGKDGKSGKQSGQSSSAKQASSSE